jgi:CheY-like chemotaxis protein
MLIRVRVRMAAAALVAACASLSALAFPDPGELLNDYIHYAKVANTDLAAASAQALLDSGISNADLAKLVDEGKITEKRIDEAIARAQLVPALEVVTAELSRRIEAGRLDLARDTKRIDEAVQMLVRTQRERLIAKQRLAAAKEYAVPALLKIITDGSNEQLKLAAQDMIVDIGGPAVSPMCAALLALNGNSQRIVCDLLGRIKHPNAAPYLRELAMDDRADNAVREAAARAFRTVGGVEMPLSRLYSNLARQYFDGNESLVAFPAEDTNNVWKYDQFVGLTPTPVPTPIYGQIMALRTSRHSVNIDPRNSDALALCVASNLKRENDLPEGATDPIYGNEHYTPEFFATVFGTQTCLDVLGLAIDKTDTPLVRDAIAALSKTTGGANLFARGKGRQPLLEALEYPDRRVQYEAALTLAHALPQQSFTGDHYVVPLLASAVRMGSKSLALVIADDEENRRNAVMQLEQMGFQIVGAGSGLAEVQVDIGRAVGVDLAVVRVRSADTARQIVTDLRRIAKTAAAPVLLVAAATDLAGLQRDYRDDQRVLPARAGIAPENFEHAVESVMKRGAGGRMTEAQSEEYAILALGALHDVAISHSAAFAIADAESALLDALAARSGGMREKVAEILAMIDSDRSQRQLFDAAFAAKDDEQVALLHLVADSVRRFGDRAEPRHVAALVDLVATSKGETAEAAATVHGSLNLPLSEAMKLIPKE